MNSTLATTHNRAVSVESNPLREESILVADPTSEECNYRYAAVKPAVVTKGAEETTNAILKKGNTTTFDGAATKAQEEEEEGNPEVSFPLAQLAMMALMNQQSRDQPATKAVIQQAARELATGLSGEEALTAEVTEEQFRRFQQQYVLDPTGSRELLGRAGFLALSQKDHAAKSNTLLDGASSCRRGDQELWGRIVEENNHESAAAMRNHEIQQITSHKEGYCLPMHDSEEGWLDDATMGDESTRFRESIDAERLILKELNHNTTLHPSLLRASRRLQRIQEEEEEGASEFLDCDFCQWLEQKLSLVLW